MAKPSLAIALGFSFLIHGALLALTYLPGLLPILVPRSPITFELIKNSKVQTPSGPPSEPKPEPKQEPAKDSPKQGVAMPKPQPLKKNKPQAPPPIVNLSALPQDGASVLLILRMAKLRRSPHLEAAKGLLSAFPDARLLAQGLSLQESAFAGALIADLSALIITTTDPKDLVATALLAIHKDAAIVRALRERHIPPWDPRLFVELTPELAAYAHREVIETWQTTLEGESFGKRLSVLLQAEAVVSLEVRNLDRLVRLQEGLPTPRTIRASLSGETDPAARVQFEMASLEDAQAAAAALPVLRETVSARLRWLGLGKLLDGLQVSQQGTQVVVSGRAQKADVTLLLGLVQALLARLPLPQIAPPDLGFSVPSPDLAPRLDLASPAKDLGDQVRSE